MSKADKIANSVGYDSISAFVATLRRCASEPDLVIPGDLLDAASVIECLVTEVYSLTTEVDRLTTEVDRLAAEVKRLTDKVDRLSDKIDDLKEVMRNRQER